MKYIIYDKKTLKIVRIMNKEPIALTDNLGLARCESIPQGDNFKVSNIQTHAENYIEKEPKEVTKVDEQGNEYTETEYEEVVKTREYQTCEIMPKIYSQTEINNKKDKEYELLVERLIRQKYSQSQVEAILNNYIDGTENEEYKTEFVELQNYRKQCKAKAKEIIYKG